MGDSAIKVERANSLDGLFTIAELLKESWQLRTLKRLAHLTFAELDFVDDPLAKGFKRTMWRGAVPIIVSFIPMHNTTSDEFALAFLALLDSQPPTFQFYFDVFFEPKAPPLEEAAKTLAKILRMKIDQEFFRAQTPHQI